MALPYRLSFLASISVALCLAFASGCSSDSHPEKTGGMPGVVPDYPTAMSGTENFASDKIAVEVTLGLSSDFRAGKEGGKQGGGGHSGSHRGGSGRHGSSGMGGGGAYPGLQGGGEALPAGDDSGEVQARPVMGSTLPPAQLKLHLRNLSPTDTVACEVVDFNSTLGNFAVFPSAYKIDSSQTASSETMTSRLGVEGSEIPVTVALRVNGHVERKVIMMHMLPLPDKPSVPELSK